MINEFERIMGIWAGHSPPSDPIRKMASHKFNFPMQPKMHLHVHALASNSR
jgi:hypothetical protein